MQFALPNPEAVPVVLGDSSSMARSVQPTAGSQLGGCASCLAWSSWSSAWYSSSQPDCLPRPPVLRSVPNKLLLPFVRLKRQLQRCHKISWRYLQLGPGTLLLNGPRLFASCAAAGRAEPLVSAEKYLPRLLQVGYTPQFFLLLFSRASMA